MPAPDTLRVVFTGHAGLAKSTAIQALVELIHKRDHNWQAANKLDDQAECERIERRLAQWYESEALLKELPERFLKLEWGEQRRRWRRSLLDAIEQWEQAEPQPQYAFLSLHLSYQWHGGFFSPLSWRTAVSTPSGERMENTLVEVLRDRFKPDMCVALIDDVHAAQRRIAPGIHLRLRELMTWRNFEVILTDLLANDTVLPNRPELDSVEFPFAASPVVAIRHTPAMLYRLLMDHEAPRVYASYPISRTRGTDKHREEIDRFRRALRSDCVVYDPVTIDERCLLTLLEDWEKQPVEGTTPRPQGLTVKAEDRWPIPGEETLCGEGPMDYPNLDIEQIEEIAHRVPGEKTEIERNIEARDFRLIDQADCVVIYRPLFEKGEFSGGTHAEALYAERRGKPILLVHDPKNDGTIEPETFDIEVPREPDYFGDVEDLSIPENQRKVLERVIERVKERQAEFLRHRSASLAPS